MIQIIEAIERLLGMKPDSDDAQPTHHPYHWDRLRGALETALDAAGHIAVLSGQKPDPTMPAAPAPAPEPVPVAPVMDMPTAVDEPPVPAADESVEMPAPEGDGHSGDGEHHDG